MKVPARSLLAGIACVLAGCASQPAQMPGQGRVGCESFIIYDICVQDYRGDGRADIIYFADTYEVFMYRAGEREAATDYYPLHRCAIRMSDSTVALSSRLLYGDDLGFLEEMDLKRRLLENYAAAKPGVDACMDAALSGAEALEAAEDEFLSTDVDW